MIAMSKEMGENWLVEGKHYIVLDRMLYLDMSLVHVYYKRYVRTNRGTPVIDSVSQFRKLLEQELYFVTFNALLKDMSIGRPLTQLSLDKMVEKGMDVSLFNT